MKIFKMRKFWLACAVLSVLALTACGDDDESSSAALDLAETLSDLPSCKSSNSGTVQYVSSEDAYYVCYDGSWELVAGILEGSSSSSAKVSSSSEADSIYSVTDLSECTSETEGNVKYVSSEAAYYVCTGGDWTAFATDSTALSSSSTSLTPSDLGVECDSTWEGWIWLGYYCTEGEWRELVEIEEEETDTTAECGDFETWLYGSSRVETGCDDGSNTYGYWHAYTEAASITWPAELGADTAELFAVMDSCAGAICGTATFNNSDGTSYVGVEFNIGGDSLKGYNILEWRGIDLVFSFGHLINESYSYFNGKIQIELVPEDEENYTGGDNFTATIYDTEGSSLYYTLTGSGVRSANGWEDFEQAGTGIEVPMAEFLTRVAKIRVKFSGYYSNSTSCSFNIYQIGEYGTWSDWPGFSSSSESEE